MREQVPSSKNSSNYGKSVRNSILRRTAITQLEQDSNAVPTQEEIENQQYQQDQFDATSLEIQAKYETITPEGQERLNLLQAKKAEFWQRYLAPVRHSKDFANIPITHAQAEAKSKKAIQAKLTIGAAGDKYEQEADRVAAQVVNQINSPVSQQPTQNLQREEMAEEDELMKKPEISGIQCEVIPEEEELQMKQAGEGGMAAPAELESSIQQARGGGQPLADNIRKPMEHAFGCDFSGVKVHADSQADQLNQSIQARAFTTGHDVFFRQGEYQPGSRGGQELIAHELTHVVQQNEGAKERRSQREEVRWKEHAQDTTRTRRGDGVLQRTFGRPTDAPIPDRLEFTDATDATTAAMILWDVNGNKIEERTFGSGGGRHAEEKFIAYLQEQVNNSVLVPHQAGHVYEIFLHVSKSPCSSTSNPATRTDGQMGCYERLQDLCNQGIVAPGGGMVRFRLIVESTKPYQPRIQGGKQASIATTGNAVYETMGDGFMRR